MRKHCTAAVMSCIKNLDLQIKKTFYFFAEIHETEWTFPLFVNHITFATFVKLTLLCFFDQIVWPKK